MEILEKIDAGLKRYSKAIKELEVDSYWYRRVVHACAGPSVLVLFLLANESWLRVVKMVGPPIFFALIVGMDVLRLKGILPQDMFYGIRDYERNRFMGYTYFAIAGITLLMLAQCKLIPQAIAVGCFLCGCLVDPAMGEVRQAKGRRFGMPVGFLLALVLLIALGFRWDISLFGAFLVVMGESVKSKIIDDDFLIQMAPALGLIILWRVGLPMPPDPIASIPIPEWAYVDMTQLPFFGVALAIIIVVLVSFGFAYYGFRRVNKGISATKSMLPIILFLMIAPLVLGLIFFYYSGSGRPISPHLTTHTSLGLIMIISTVLADIATVRAMARKRLSV
jgi:hypothetical protein